MLTQSLPVFAVLICAGFRWRDHHHYCWNAGDHSMGKKPQLSIAAFAADPGHASLDMHDVLYML